MHQGPRLCQPVGREVGLLNHDSYGEALERRDEVRQGLEKPDRARIDREHHTFA